MRSTLGSLLLFVVVAGAWGALAWVADEGRVGAALLHAEPLLWLAVAVLVWQALHRRRWGVAFGLLAGTTVGGGVLRMPGFPLRAVAPEAEASLSTPDPAWFGAVRRCAAALDAPSGDVSLLTWTLDPTVDAATVFTVGVTLHPDLLVLQRAADATDVDRIAAKLGGEAAFVPGEDGAPGVGLVVRGQFPLCGTDDAWAEDVSSRAGLGVRFVQIGDSVYFPLVTLKTPSPGGSDDWDGDHVALVRRAGDVVEALGSDATLLVGDVTATSTYRWMDAELAGRGFAPAAMPPTWPAHVLGVPFPELQPLDRLWAGSAWEVQAQRVEVPAGTRAPVYLRLTAGSRTGSYQRPTRPSRPGPT